MSKFNVTYSMDVLYSVDIEADNADDAEENVKQGNFNTENADIIGEEFLQVNKVTPL
jgi:DNA-dependent RNA polymerase auxiliary subunit epsilon